MAPLLLDIELFGIFAQGRQPRQSLVLERPLTAGEIATRLELSMEAIGLIVVDGVQTEPEYLITKNCRVCFFPHMSGG